MPASDRISLALHQSGTPLPSMAVGRATCPALPGEKGTSRRTCDTGRQRHPKIVIRKVRLDPRIVKLGSRLRFAFEIASTGVRDQDLVIDYVVHFLKANDLVRAKVFKLRRITLAPSARIELSSTVRFETMTTRSHYPGRHRIDVLVNGVSMPLAQFRVLR